MSTNGRCFSIRWWDNTVAVDIFHVDSNIGYRTQISWGLFWSVEKQWIKYDSLTNFQLKLCAVSMVFQHLVKFYSFKLWKIPQYLLGKFQWAGFWMAHTLMSSLLHCIFFWVRGYVFGLGSKRSLYQSIFCTNLFLLSNHFTIFCFEFFETACSLILPWWAVSYC